MKECGFLETALGRFVLVGIKTGFMNSFSYGRTSPMGKIKSPQCFEILCVEPPACAAVQANAIGSSVIRKRAAKAFVPAAKEFAKNAYFAAKRIVLSFDCCD